MANRSCKVLVGFFFGFLQNFSLKVADIWNLNAICRCCHKDGYFRSMQYPYVEDGDVEIYNCLMKEVFGIIMVSPPMQASEMICDRCVSSLRDARTFRKQVVECELRFQQYCSNEANVKREPGCNIIDNDLEPKGEDKISIKMEADDDIESLANESNNQELNCDLDNNCDSHSDSDSEPSKKESNEKGKKGASNVKRTRTVKKNAIVKANKGLTTKPAIKRKTIKCEETKIKDELETTSKKQEPKLKTAVVRKKSKVAKTGRIETLYTVRCKHCGMYLRNYKFLREHYNTAHEGEQQINVMEISCEFCKETVQGIPKYKTHINAMHPGNGRVCNLCPRIFQHLSLMKQHLDTCHNHQAMYECDYCKKKFRDKHVIRNHILLHLEAAAGKRTRDTTCPMCGLQLSNPYNLKYHITQVHENIRAFLCEYCPNTYKTKRLMKEHAANKHTNSKQERIKPYSCTKCDKKFISRRDMMKHEDAKHKDGAAKKIVKKDGEVIPLWKRIYKCFVCKEPFQGRTVYRKHLRKEHDGAMPYQCHICAKSFTTNFTLLRHLYAHDNTQPVECNVCLKTFKHELFLKEHIKRTHGNKNRNGTVRVAKEDHVKCDLCNRYVQHLETHRQAHFKRPHKCTVCSKDYTSKSILNRHMKEHFQLHSCDICNATFKRPNSIIKHKQRKHPEALQRGYNYNDDQGDCRQRKAGQKDSKRRKKKVSQRDSIVRQIQKTHPEEVQRDYNNDEQGDSRQGEVDQRDMKCELEGDARSLEDFNSGC